MGKITDTVKVLLIANILFFIGYNFVGEVAREIFATHYLGHPNFKIWQIITHMFMHFGFTHLIFNMYGLYAFGSVLENIWGQKKFLFFYFSAGLGAFLLNSSVDYWQFQSSFNELITAGFNKSSIYDMLNVAERQAFSNPEGQYSVPFGVDADQFSSLINTYSSRAAGASGAIYGILVGFGMYYPNAELMLIFVPIPIKAKYFIPIVLLATLIFGISGTFSGIGHWAHLGGAIIGFIMTYYWKKNSFNDKRWN